MCAWRIDKRWEPLPESHDFSTPIRPFEIRHPAVRKISIGFDTPPHFRQRDSESHSESRCSTPRKMGSEFPENEARFLPIRLPAVRTITIGSDANDSGYFDSPALHRRRFSYSEADPDSARSTPRKIGPGQLETIRRRLIFDNLGRGPAALGPFGVNWKIPVKSRT